jgi:fructose-specific PTS system IIA-like component
LLEQALRCSTRAQVESLLDDYTPSGQPLPLLSSDLLLQSQAISKAEAIKEMADALWLSGRAREGQLLEEAIWQREDAYSTGFGYGFALPHCKSDQVIANSIVVAKLDNVVEWGSTDKLPVDVVILVAMRSADYEKAHMRVFAQLSRLVMREEFRDRVRDFDGLELLSFLKETLGLDALRTS